MKNYISNTSLYSSLNLTNLCNIIGISKGDVENAMKKAELNRILKQHPYKITLPSGRWQTYVKDDTLASGRKKLVKPTEEKLNIALYEYYKEQDEQTLRQPHIKDIVSRMERIQNITHYSSKLYPAYK